MKTEKGKGKDRETRLKRHKQEDSVFLSKAEYEELKNAASLAEEHKDKYLRAHAELDNMQKRFVKEKEGYIKFANEDLLIEILYAVDNFDRAIEHMNKSDKIESLLEGIKIIQKQFHSFLEQRGVQRIETAGQKFNPGLHEAVEHLEADESKDGVIIEEIQPGYVLNGRLLRPAIVKVGRKKENDLNS